MPKLVSKRWFCWLFGLLNPKFLRFGQHFWAIEPKILIKAILNNQRRGIYMDAGRPIEKSFWLTFQNWKWNPQGPKCECRKPPWLLWSFWKRHFDTQAACHSTMQNCRLSFRKKPCLRLNSFKKCFDHAQTVFIKTENGRISALIWNRPEIWILRVLAPWIFERKLWEIISLEPWYVGGRRPAPWDC